jgi:hypothetical protein
MLSEYIQNVKGTEATAPLSEDNVHRCAQKLEVGG